jgi:AhpD family alkylhydroperoxidase
MPAAPRPLDMITAGSEICIEQKISACMSHRQVLSRHGVGTKKGNGTMTVKLDPFAAAPSLMKSWAGLSIAIASSLEPTLIELVKIRSSQINGCANCINMHTAEARAKGETEQRIYLLSAWREAPCYTDRERAALGWTEALTRLSEGHAHERAYEALKAQFTQEEQVKLTLMINVINGWNRIAVGFGLFADRTAAKAAAKAAA